MRNILLFSILSFLFACSSNSKNDVHANNEDCDYYSITECLKSNEIIGFKLYNVNIDLNNDLYKKNKIDSLSFITCQSCNLNSISFDKYYVCDYLQIGESSIKKIDIEKLKIKTLFIYKTKSSSDTLIIQNKFIEELIIMNSFWNNIIFNDCINIEILNLSQNSFVKLDTSIYNLEKLEKLNIAGSDFENFYPHKFKNLSSLTMDSSYYLKNKLYYDTLKNIKITLAW